MISDALADVFIMPPSREELRRRLVKRGTETPEQIERRLANAAREVARWRDYRYTIISGSVEEDLRQIPRDHAGRALPEPAVCGFYVLTVSFPVMTTTPQRSPWSWASPVRSPRYKAADIASQLTKRGRAVQRRDDRRGAAIHHAADAAGACRSIRW